MLPDNICFTDNPANALTDFLKDKHYSSIAVLVDDHTETACYPLIADSLPPHHLITIPHGEEQKTIETCVTIWRALTARMLDRHSLLIALGGGVLGDMGGFCAATYKRGIDFLLIPTSLLAQVDASIGGKLGVDFDNFKNHIGVFQLPVLTLLYSGFLKTLPENELRSGYAEVIKHILTSDSTMWEQIRKEPLEKQAWDTLIKHSVAFKANVVTEDPKEKGLRKILNAGHTIGHATESYFISINKRILHGEAIAIGLVAEAFIAFKRGTLQKTALDQIAQYILDIYGKEQITDEDIDKITRLAIQDKKNKGNKILCVLQNDIGNATWDNEISLEEIKEALQFYRDQT